MLEANEWFLGHSLAERLRAGPPAGDVDDERGRIRLRMWKDEPVHRDVPDGIGAQLARHGLDEAGLVRILGESPESVRARFGGDGAAPPGFATRVAEAWRRFGTAAPSDEERQATLPGFAPLVAPLLREARHRVRSRVDELVGAHTRLSVEGVANTLGIGPVEAVDHLTARTLVLELNVARVRGTLAGAGPRERYEHFLRLLGQPDYGLAILREYPVLARDLVRLIDNWQASRLEFVDRLVADYDEIADRCGGRAALGDLAEVRFGAGDSHRQGRSVAVVRFQTGVRVMYKPRRLEVDRHFQELVAWLNARGDHEALRTFWVFDRPGYGWTEFIDAAACADRAAVGRFYQRQGALLALLHTLGAIDLHLENVIAAGEHPVVIDLEALFHSWQMRATRSAGDQVSQVAGDLMRRSVLTVGLLPTPMVWADGNEVQQLDLSGITGAGGQLTLSPLATFDEPGTDQMHLVRHRIAMQDADNLPSLHGAHPDVVEFRDELIQGFRSMYRTLLLNREALGDADGPLAAFAHDEIRVVVRPTHQYMNVIAEARHPDLLRDALDRDRFYENLWSAHHDRPNRDALIASELAQIHGGDVPIFLTTPSSTGFVGADGTVLAGMVDRSGMRIARDRLAALSGEQLARQTWFIQASLTALIMGDPARWPAQPALEGTAAPAPAGGYLEGAARIADRLLETAIVDGDRIGWLGLNLVADKVWNLNPAGMDLYNGISGIGFFLGYLAKVSGDPAYRRAAERVAGMMSRQADDWLASPVRPMADDLGAFGRLGGPVYALSHLALVLDRDDLADTAERLADLMISRVGDDHALDVIGGAAGAILALLSLHAIRPAPAVLDGAHTMARHLMAAAEEIGTGLAWRGAVNPEAPLAGLSHGASGVALALARLDRRTGSTTHRGPVSAALRFEQTLFDARIGNWRDLRTGVGGSHDLVTWCHGAGGIGLVRAELLEYADDPLAVRRELRAAALAISELGFQNLRNHSLCHGHLGNSEALLIVARRLGDPDLVRRAETTAAATLADVDERRWRCGVPLGVETPGLMSGLAGIGYGLLRFAGADSIPSVLLLDPPMPRTAASIH
ncbi:type 2 lantipeptide synthetase LanM family protein [Micromonospora sp. CPCC 205371]|nr:type 2 lantipeptide synthetase LanM family protein [Micromonospora sp. CPCC 205371]